MDITQQGVIALLKAAITGERAALPETFDLSAALQRMQNHHVVPLLYEGAFRCGISPVEPVMQQLFRTSCRILIRSEGQMRDVRRICAAFDENGIDYLPLKGCRMKALYPRPELRLMGDADILIRTEQYDRIRPVMQQLGFREGEETVHELIWESDNLYLELHKQMIPSYNEDLYTYFGTGWQRAVRESGNRYALTAEDEWIFLFTHFAKHFRDGGIGCRHVVDLWVYLRACPEMDEAHIRAGLGSMQLLEFYDNIRRLLDVWFGGGESDEKTELISQLIFSSGSFGAEEMRLLSRTIRDADKGDKKRNGRLVYFCKTAFPDVTTLRGKYRVLQKAPWMLPAVWVYRPFYNFFAEGERLKKHHRNLEVLTDEKMDARREILHCVGLDYRF